MNTTVACVVGGLVTLTAAGCARSLPAVPPELSRARHALQELEQGPAVTVTPEAVAVARASLADAERAYLANPTSPESATLAYIAERRAEIAISSTGAVLAVRRRNEAERELREARHATAPAQTRTAARP